MSATTKTMPETIVEIVAAVERRDRAAGRDRVWLRWDTALAAALRRVWEERDSLKRSMDEGFGVFEKLSQENARLKDQIRVFCVLANLALLYADDMPEYVIADIRAAVREAKR
jgi:hypothetical protein